MTKKNIKELAKYSYIHNTLDERKVNKIAKLMDRKMLKSYLRELKAIEKQNTVIIATSDRKSYNTGKQIFERMFSNKHIIVKEDPTLLLGVRIIDADMIYEKSLDNSLHAMLTTIEKQYE